MIGNERAWRGTSIRPSSHPARLVEDCPDRRPVLVQQNLSDQSFVREDLFPQIQVGDVTDSLEAARSVHARGEELLKEETQEQEGTTVRLKIARCRRA